MLKELPMSNFEVPSWHLSQYINKIYQNIYTPSLVLNPKPLQILNISTNQQSITLQLQLSYLMSVF
jgi:hypothetical protein